MRKEASFNAFRFQIYYLLASFVDNSHFRCNKPQYHIDKTFREYNLKFWIGLVRLGIPEAIQRNKLN